MQVFLSILTMDYPVLVIMQRDKSPASAHRVAARLAHIRTLGNLPVEASILAWRMSGIGISIIDG